MSDRNSNSVTDVIQSLYERSQRMDDSIRNGRINFNTAVNNYAWVARKDLLGTVGMARTNAAVADEANDYDYSIPFIITTYQEDRDGDVVVPMGCELSDYRLSPVIFFGHQENPYPIAKAQRPNGELAVYPEEYLVRSVAYFDQADEDAMFIYGKVKRGFLNAASVAFVPIEAYRRSEIDKAHRSNDGPPNGWLFKRWSMTEWSIVGIPSNAGAIRDALDTEKSFISPRLQKAMKPYAAKSKKEQNIAWTGWCPNGNCEVQKSVKQLVVKGRRRIKKKKVGEFEYELFEYIDDKTGVKEYSGVIWNGSSRAYEALARQAPSSASTENEMTNWIANQGQTKSAKDLPTEDDKALSPITTGDYAWTTGTPPTRIKVVYIEGDTAVIEFQDGGRSKTKLSRLEKSMTTKKDKSCGCHGKKSLSENSGTNGGYTVPAKDIPPCQCGDDPNCPDCGKQKSVPRPSKDPRFTAAMDSAMNELRTLADSKRSNTRLGEVERGKLLSELVNKLRSKIDSAISQLPPKEQADASKEADLRFGSFLRAHMSLGNQTMKNKSTKTLVKTKPVAKKAAVKRKADLDEEDQVTKDEMPEEQEMDEDVDNMEEKEDEPAIMKPSAAVIAKVYSHAKAEDDFLTKELETLDHPGVEASLKKYHAKHVTPRMEHLKDMMSDHHPNMDMDKCMKALETDGTGGSEENPGEAGMVEEGEVPPMKSMRRRRKSADDDKAYTAGWTACTSGKPRTANPYRAGSPEYQDWLQAYGDAEEQGYGPKKNLEGDHHTEEDKDLDLVEWAEQEESEPEHQIETGDEGLSPDEDTEEILERYQHPKSHKWLTRKVGTLKRLKDGRTFLVKEIEEDEKGGPGSGPSPGSGGKKPSNGRKPGESTGDYSRRMDAELDSALDAKRTSERRRDSAETDYDPSTKDLEDDNHSQETADNAAYKDADEETVEEKAAPNIHVVQLGRRMLEDLGEAGGPGWYVISGTRDNTTVLDGPFSSESQAMSSPKYKDMDEETVEEKASDSPNEKRAYEYAKRNQGFEGTYQQWLQLSSNERAEYEEGAQGIGTKDLEDETVADPVMAKAFEKLNNRLRMMNLN